MKKLQDIITLSKKYDEAFDRRNERLKIWGETTLPLVKSVLENLSLALIEEVSFYKSNMYVSGHVNTPLDGVSIRCGTQIVTNTNDRENGFCIQFSPANNGKIHVIAYSHSLAESEQRGEEIGLVDPEELNNESIIDFVSQGIEKVQSSSQLFYGYE
jgi:hypothetical protein